MTNQPTPPAANTAKPEPKEGKGGFRDTLNLPQTAFPMKANLVQNEPASIKRWGAMGLYQRVRERCAAEKREPFVFHDGPPYANGSIHMGHLMNKCLKDFVVRTRTMAGFDVPYIPGWDCHGLPIEHKVMTELVEKGKFEKLKTLEDGARRMAIRRECKTYAEKFHKLHTQQFTRLMTLADYEHPYLTMQPEYEGATLEVLAALLDRGLVYRALKPVHWSIANETALAEAELEYEDREDLSVYVDFEAADAESVYDAFGLPKTEANAEETEEEEEEHRGDAGEEGASGARKPAPGTRPRQTPCFMIWTTTPWTLPANLAIAVNPKFTYALVWVDGNITILAADAVDRVTKAGKAEEVVVLAQTTGDRLVGLRYRHPFVDLAKNEGAGALDMKAHRADVGRAVSLDKVFTVLPAEYVTLEDGTGLVHTAPGHGVEDYATGAANGLPVYCPVKADGFYDTTVSEWLRPLDVWKANEKVAQRLAESGHLFYKHTFTHSYPHDWRSKTPTIFRCTRQWFVGVDMPSRGGGAGTSLRAMASAATGPSGSVQFVPDWGRNRMHGMLEARPDWCISRQRSWGLPIPAFFYTDEKGEEQVFMTVASVNAVAKVVRGKTSDAWFQSTPQELLAQYDPKADPDCPAFLAAQPAALSALRKGQDILDVWFESGSSWNAVLRERSLGYPADLYLEGSDQHRGWFQLALLTALGATGKPPYKTLLTHGFMVDRDGRKLSKSKGDSVEDLFTKFGVDVLRWWVASLSYENDVKVDEEFFNLAGESYRKVRNTLRFMLSNLSDYAPTSAPSAHDFPPASLDAWVLAEFALLCKDVTAAYDNYDFRGAHSRLYSFCNDTLSATYLAAVKDRLYCDKPDSPRRRQTQATLWLLTDGLCRLLAPVLTHTADETYRALLKADAPNSASKDACVHLLTFGESPKVTADSHWPALMKAAAAAQQAMEKAKTSLGVENPLDMGVTLPDPDGAFNGFDPADLADLLGVSRVNLDPAAKEPAIADLRAEPRCERSWKRDTTVKPRPAANNALLSDRDALAIGKA